jgi:hypothetical protein
MAEFHIKHTLFALPSNLYPESHEHLRPSLVTAHIAIDLFVKDIVTMVNAGVKDYIQEKMESEDLEDNAIARRTTKNLPKWTKLRNPLSYDNGLLLIPVVNPSGANIPKASVDQLNLDDFISRLIDIHEKPRVSGLPFIPKGQFQHVLPIALKKLLIFAADSERNKRTYVTEIFRTVMLASKINMIPWSAPSQAGRPGTTPVWNAWTTFGSPVSVQAIPQPRDIPNNPTAAMQRSIDLVRDNDVLASWEACPLKISSLQKYLNRHVLPSDFKNPAFAPSDEAAYVKETYEYVRQRINLQLPLHQLALCIAIVFSKLCPRVFTEAPTSVPLELVNSEEDAQLFLTTLPWVSRAAAGKRGNSQRDLYICMVTVYIIALYDSASPLRVYHTKHQSLGRFWTDKHSNSCRSLIYKALITFLF